MRRLLFLLLISYSYSAVGQDLTNYQPLECQGPIPDAFIIPSAEKYRRESDLIHQESADELERKDKNDFALQVNFALDDILQSGLILYNDPIGTYLQEVLDFLHEASASPGSTPQVYIVRTPGVNAFATDRGSVFVTMGLLSQLENEAQLAFILAHELVHYEKRHSRELFLEALEIEREMARGPLRKLTIDEVLVSKNYYSKELENEADLAGLEKILKTNYSLSTLNTVYDVLKYAYLPYDEIPFSVSFFEDEGYVFPSKLVLEEVNAIEGLDEHEVDTRSSHPNIGSRRAALLARIEPYLEEERQDFIVSETRFREARDRARFELPQLYLYEDGLAEALYTAHALLQQFPDNAYLKKSIAKALYCFAAYRNGSVYGYSIQYSEVEGELQRVYYFLKKLNAKEATILTLRYLYQLHLDYPEDTAVKGMLEDAFEFLAVHVESLAEFKTELPATDPAPEAPSTEATDQEKSKFEKIREQQRQAALPGEKEYWKLAFIPYLQDTTFQQGFEAGKAAFEEDERRNTYYASREGRLDYRAYQKEVRKHGLRLGIERIGVVQPLYLLLNNRYESAPLYLESEAGKIRFRERLRDQAAALDLEVLLLDPEILQEDEVQVFNDIRYLNDWIGQQLMHDNLPLMVSYDQERIRAIAERYQTDYFLWTGIIGLDKGKGIFIYALLFDLQTGKREVVKYELLNKRLKDKFVEKQLFNMLSQIRSAR